MVVAAVNVRQGIRGKLAAELRHYGANLLLVPKKDAGSFLEEKDLAVLRDPRVKDRLTGYAPFLYALASVQGKPVVLGGTHFRRVKELSPWWHVEGRAPREKGEALVGANAASKLGLRVGDRFSAVTQDSARAFSVAGILRTGGAEEHQVFVPLESLQLLTGRPGLLSSVLLRGRAEEGRREAVAFLRRAWPGAEPRTLSQVAGAEEAVLSRLTVFLTLVSLLVLFSAGVGVFASTTTAALERRAEVALMRALGAERRAVARVLACEAAGIGLIGGVLGCVLGLLFAEAIGLSVFRSFVFPGWMSLAAGPALGVGVALLSSLSVVRRTAAAAPAAVLRGE